MSRNMPGMRWATAILIMTAVSLLAIGTAMDVDPSEHPLPITVEPAESGDVLARLAARGISSAIVAGSRPGLDPRDVSVADRFGNKFRSRYGYSHYSLDKRDFDAADIARWDAEFTRNEQLRLEWERRVRSYISNFQYEGDVDVFSRYESNSDAGEDSANTVPVVKNISLFVHMPFRLTREENDGRGNRTKTLDPIWRRESDSLSEARKYELISLIKYTTPAYDHENGEVWIYEIPWSVPTYPFEEGDP